MYYGNTVTYTMDWSYLLLIGAFILHEKITLIGIIGALLIILASIGNELFADKD